MMDIGTNRLYGDLAWLWPLWGDPETEYARYCQWLAAQLRRRAQRELRTLLDAGCGGGKNIFNLRRQFQVTGLDRSGRMLALAAKLNPGCELIQADLRSFDLGCQFDAVFLDDAVSYLLTEADVAGALRQFRKHLAPGGVLGFSLDATTESFQNNRTQVFQSVPSAKHPDTEVTFVTHEYVRADADPPCQTALRRAPVQLLLPDPPAGKAEHRDRPPCPGAVSAGRLAGFAAAGGLCGRSGHL